MDRLAARNNFHPGGHTDRDRFVISQHRPIFAPYNALQAASKIARYGTLNQFNLAYPGTTVQDILIDQKLVVIEAYVNNIFSPPSPPPPPVAATGS